MEGGARSREGGGNPPLPSSRPKTLFAVGGGTAATAHSQYTGTQHTATAAVHNYGQLLPFLFSKYPRSVWIVAPMRRSLSSGVQPGGKWTV